jgi:glycosyltransferase involved in cell wall biosynthesis
LLYSGRLAPLKRVDLALEAFAAIAAARPDWGLLIAGDGPLRQGLAGGVPEGLRGRVRWLGFLEVEQVRLAYHAAQALVLPSDKEPWALVVNEAMAAGLPIVSSDMVGASADLIQNGGNGRLFSAGSVRELTGALLEVTEATAYAKYRAAVAPALERWRLRADPVQGLRRALTFTGVLPRGVGAGAGV